MPEPTFTDDEIERRVMERLRASGLPPYARPVSGFYHPADQRVVRDLEKQGRLTSWPGEGKDYGLLLAQLVDTAPTRAIEGGAA